MVGAGEMEAAVGDMAAAGWVPAADEAPVRVALLAGAWAGAPAMAGVRLSSAGRVAPGGRPGGTGQPGAGRAGSWAGASSSQAQQAISAPTKMQ
jgi:hypothetical protein